MNLNNAARRGITRLVQGVLTLMTVLAISFFAGTPVKADSASAASLCGNGFAPDYGFSYDLQQSHWTVGETGTVSGKTVNAVDAILDQLNSDSIAQTMILILPQAKVGNRVNCAVHFLRYMQLGLPSGARKDNGFVFLIVVEPKAIDVHYGVGLGLPALTASELTTLNRTAEDTYQSSQSMDQALLALAQGFDAVARNKYAPLTSAATTGTNSQSQAPAGPLDILSICGQLCFGILFLFLLIFVRPFLARRGININPTGFGSGGWGGRLGGGGGFGGGRGGSGSGRSGRGN